MQITFIENPKFLVDFEKFVPKRSSTINYVALLALKSVGIFFQSLIEAAFKTFFYSGTSFKHIVLGYYGRLSDFRPPKDIYLAVVKLHVWVISMIWCIVKTTSRLCFERINTEPYLTRLEEINTEIDFHHFLIEDTSLDASVVPKEITLDGLLIEFQKINFEQKEDLCYMPSSYEGGVLISKEELQRQLELFVERVKKREPYIGTPPSYDTPRLMAFYQQIEDAVRLSLHALTQKVQNFEKENSDTSRLDEEAKKEYKNLLENKFRFILDLAIGGGHCGARYMGEAMSAYYNYCDNGLKKVDTLEEYLKTILSRKRKEILEKIIQSKITNDNQSTHLYTLYMGVFGQMLGIPGTKNIIETLKKNLDEKKTLEEFFKNYSVEFIIEEIQKEIKNSEEFRNRVNHWLTNQIGDWDLEKYEKILAEKEKELTQKIEDIISAQEDKLMDYDIVIELLKCLKKQEILNNENLSWQDFMEEIFAITANFWKDQKISILKKNQIKMIFIQNQTLFEKYFLPNKLDQEEEIRQFFSIRSKIAKIRALINDSKSEEGKNEDEEIFQEAFSTVPEDTIKRIIEKKVTIKDGLKYRLLAVREQEFLQKLNMSFESNLSSAILEWILVANHILKPQSKDFL